MDEKIEKKLNSNKADTFILFDKRWLDNLKKIVGYEELKEECSRYECSGYKFEEKIINKAKNIFLKLNTNQKLKELGKMDCTYIMKYSKHKLIINEKSNFIMILSNFCTYFIPAINNIFTVTGGISNGIIYIHELFREIGKEKIKIILLFKKVIKNEFIRYLIIHEPNINIKNVIKLLKRKNIEEFFDNQKEFKIEMIKPISIIEEEIKRKNEERKRKEEEEEKKRKEEIKRKEEEKEERKIKEMVERKKREEEEEKMKRKNEEIKRKEEEERKIKETEERKKREEEEMKRKEEDEKKRKEMEEKKSNSIDEKQKEKSQHNFLMNKKRITLDDRNCSLGLDNVGTNSSLNAILQCFAHIKKLTEYIINYREEGILNDKKKLLSEAFSEVMCGIWLAEYRKNKESYFPMRFRLLIEEINPFFNFKYNYVDAKVLLIFLIEHMHNELNKSSEKNLDIEIPDNINLMDNQLVLQYFHKEFIKKNNSVISHYLYGSNVLITFCNNCKKPKYSYECFSYIIFPLSEIKQELINSRFNFNHILNIEDCLIFKEEPKILAKKYCNICQDNKDTSIQTKISSAPLVLIIILDRGTKNLDFKEPFVFHEMIDIKNYVEFPQPDNKYFLSGVISFMGNYEHHIAFCRMSENSKWYCYNDSLVTESNFQEINKRGIPYILFYQKLKIKI